MVTVQIPLSREMLLFVESQATARGLAGPTEYLLALIAAAQQEQQQVELELRFSTALRAIERGEPNPLSAEDWHCLQKGVLNHRPTPAKSD